MAVAFWAEGTLKQMLQEQGRAERFREPRTVLEIRVFKGQERGFRLENRMRPEGRVCEQSCGKKR